jgi:hypothetical protein
MCAGVGLLEPFLCAAVFSLLVGFGCDESEASRRLQEIERFQTIIKRAKQDPTNPAPARELVSYSDRKNDWDRTQMFAQMRELGRVYRDNAKARPLFEVIMLPVIKKGLNDSSGFVRREAALAAKAFGSLSKPAMPELIQAMRKYPNEDTALFAVEALGEIGPDARGAIPDIEAAAKNWTQFERSINGALKKIRGESKQPE